MVIEVSIQLEDFIYKLIKNPFRLHYVQKFSLYLTDNTVFEVQCLSCKRKNVSLGESSSWCGSSVQRGLVARYFEKPQWQSMSQEPS